MIVQFFDGKQSLIYNPKGKKNKITYSNEIEKDIPCYVLNMRDFIKDEYGEFTEKPLINRGILICITYQHQVFASIKVLTGKDITDDVNVMLKEALKISSFENIKHLPLTKTTELVRNPLRRLAEGNTTDARWSQKKIIQEDAKSGLWSKLTSSYRGGEIYIDDNFKNFYMDSLNEYDIKSDFPYLLLTQKYPIGRVYHYWYKDEDSFDTDKYAYLFKFSCDHFEAIDDFVLPFANSYKDKGQIVDGFYNSNHKLVYASHFECYMNESDLELVKKCYKFDNMQLSDFYIWEKDYVPDYFRKFTHEKFKLKEQGDEVAKTTLNSIYGVTVCDHYLEKKNNGMDTKMVEREPWSIAWGIWCTSYARMIQYELYKTFDGIYSPVDCVLSFNYDESKLANWNDKVKDINIKCGYGPVLSSKDNKLHYIGELVCEKATDVYIKGIQNYIKNGHTVVGGMTRREITVEEFINLETYEDYEVSIEREYY